jgi:hypothetical protein
MTVTGPSAGGREFGAFQGSVGIGPILSGSVVNAAIML